MHVNADLGGNLEAFVSSTREQEIGRQWEVEVKISQLWRARLWRVWRSSGIVVIGLESLDTRHLALPCIRLVTQLEEDGPGETPVLTRSRARSDDDCALSACSLWLLRLIYGQGFNKSSHIPSRDCNHCSELEDSRNAGKSARPRSIDSSSSKQLHLQLEKQ